METQPTPAPGFWQKNKLIIKSFFIGFLVLALLIPTFLIMYLVNERKERKQEVTREISNKWSASQTISGPFLTVPYTETENNVLKKGYLHILPEQLDINGNIEPEIRYRSIYKVPVYTTKPLLLKGKFSRHSLNSVNVNAQSIHWNEARLCIGITDLKGLKDQQIRWGSQQLSMEAGMPENSIAEQGINALLPLDSSFLANETEFSVQLTLQGSESLFFTPLGSTTSTKLSSKWSNPAFDGRYLPDTEKINKDNFEADWKVSSFNRDYPKIFTATNSRYSISNSAFGVVLLSPFDAYAQTMRSLKYAILVIALTFFAYFFTEVFQKRPVHPLQYILIGMALVVFYTLLLSLSEYILFPVAYLSAASATVLLLSWYTYSIFKKGSTSLVFALLLCALYTFIYVLIQLQDNALLFGSIGLFILLALAMYLSRKIDWYGIDRKTTAS
ncbi:MAG TPA: cell envelope integrity protein CreD [Ferruginibacter sp.]|nr:cell envelope integrity protein CreD [Ferruginibacter sp.]